MGLDREDPRPSWMRNDRKVERSRERVHKFFGEEVPTEKERARVTTDNGVYKANNGPGNKQVAAEEEPWFEQERWHLHSQDVGNTEEKAQQERALLQLVTVVIDALSSHHSVFNRASEWKKQNQWEATILRGMQDIHIQTVVSERRYTDIKEHIFTAVNVVRSRS